LKIKLKGRHFDTTEVIKAESQVVLNTLTERDFQDIALGIEPGTCGSVARNSDHYTTEVVNRYFTNLLTPWL
jgi:hypothetical protein